MKRKDIFFCIIFAIIIIVVLALGGCSGLFESNIDGDESSTYNLQELQIVCENSNDIVYDGTYKKVAITIREKSGKIIANVSPDIESEDFILTFNNNLNAGIAEVTVTAKSTSKYKGSATTTFYIEGATANVEDVNEVIAYFDSGNYREIILIKDITLDEGITLTIPENAILDCNGYALINKGKIINEGFLKVKSISDKNGFLNEGEFINNNKILSYTAQITNTGTIENNGEIKSVSGKSLLYSNSPILGNGGNISEFNVFVRQSINDCDVSIEYEKTPFTGMALEPKITIKTNGETISSSDYEIVYENNLNVGVASVKIKAKEKALSIFGEQVLSFEIEKASIRVYTELDFIDKLSNSNYSELTVLGLTIKSDIRIESDKKVIADSATFNGSVTIDGILYTKGGAVKLNDDTTISQNGKLINEGVIYLSGRILGSVKAQNLNGGKVFVFSSATTCAWENQGFIYIDEGYTISTTGEGEVIERIRLSALNAEITNNNQKYDGSVKIPSVSFLGDISPEASTYGYDSYLVGSSDIVSPMNKGKYKVEVIFFGWSEEYCGSFTLDYEILPGEIEVSNESELISAINNDNYGKITALGDIALDCDVVISSDRELVIADTINFSSSKTISVYGKVTNNGNYAEAGIENGLNVLEEGNFINNGVGYFNSIVPSGISGEGNIFVRENIENALCLNFTSAEKIVYSIPKAVIPTFGLELNEEVLTEDEDYSVSYINYMYVTVSEEDPAIAIASAKVFSQKVFGEKRMDYMVLPGSIYVSDTETLLQAAANIRSGTNLCNWGEIILTSDIIEDTTSYSKGTLTIQSNTTLVLNDYRVTFNYGCGYKIINNGTITTTSNPWINTLTYSGLGKIVGYIDNESTSDEISIMSTFCDEINLTADVTLSDVITFNINKDCKLDLCSYTLNARINVYLEEYSLTITSTGGKGTIGSADSLSNGYYAITISEYLEGKTLTLINLDVYGIYDKLGAEIRTESSTIISST